MTGRNEGPLGVGANSVTIDQGTLSLMPTPAPGPLGLNSVGQTQEIAIDNNLRILAAMAYGESSVASIFEEMAAIANVIVRQQQARGYASVEAFVKSDRSFAFAAHDGNSRYQQLLSATLEKIAQDNGMSSAVRAAQNALSANAVDYSNGAYFWDGKDIKTNYDHHAKVRSGIHFVDPSHNIYGLANKDVPGENWLKDKEGKKLSLRGTWSYKYESTAAYGGTIFWKYNQAFLKASGNKVYD